MPVVAPLFVPADEFPGNRTSEYLLLASNEGRNSCCHLLSSPDVDNGDIWLAPERKELGSGDEGDAAGHLRSGDLVFRSPIFLEMLRRGANGPLYMDD